MECGKSSIWNVIATAKHSILNFLLWRLSMPNCKIGDICIIIYPDNYGKLCRIVMEYDARFWSVEALEPIKSFYGRNWIKAPAGTIGNIDKINVIPLADPDADTVTNKELELT
jgi:hypothetical protein